MATQSVSKAGDAVKRPEFQLGVMAFPVAARSRNQRNGEDITRVLGRFQALRQLQHPNLCRYLDLLVGREHLLFLVHEYASRTLADMLLLAPKGLGESIAMTFGRHCTAALCHLNALSLVHAHLEPQVVVIGEDSLFKLTGHGLCHLTRYGRLTDFAIRPEGQYLPPELVLDSDSVLEKSAAAATSSKPDVWSVGVMLLEVVGGMWTAEDGVVASGGKGTPDYVAAEAAVKLHTAYALKMFTRAASEQQRHLSVAQLLSKSLFDPSQHENTALQIPLARRFVDGSLDTTNRVSMQQMEDSYRHWLSSGGSGCSSQDFHELVLACLVAHPQARPSPADLSTHPLLVATTDDKDRSLEPRPPNQWTANTAMKSERVTGGLGSGGPTNPAAALGEDLSGTQKDVPPLQLLQAYGIEPEHVFYWWTTAGGDVFSVLVCKQLLRPTPPVLQLPLFVRDAEEDSAVAFLDSCVASSEAAGKNPAGSEESAVSALVTPASQTTDAQKLLEASWPVPWGSSSAKPPVSVGIDLRPLCGLVAAADGLPDTNARSLRPAWLYGRQHHFAYQWLRARLFRRLLLKLPCSREELCKEAADDVPPLLRARVWAAVLDAEWHSDANVWRPFYESLVGSQVSLPPEDRRRALEVMMQHEGISHAEGRRRLERLVHAVLKANPPLGRVDGLGTLAGPLAILYAENETVGFLVMNRILSRFLWQFYSSDGAENRRQCMCVFTALLRFVDPQLEMHLQLIGMEPEVYAQSWFTTWFAQLFTYEQLLLLWDSMLLRLPQFPLFVGACLVHCFRETLLGTDDVSQVSDFLASVAPLVDIGLLLQASVALFQAVPESVTLPLYPAYSEDDASEKAQFKLCASLKKP